ncbi:MAG TPA: MarC family protein [Candidatus Bilamarchaeaceae archaeon]|nr:MarC family protein [Candidatus Bilamarchaeaceae archaeon]
MMEFIQAFILLYVIMDPLLSLAAFFSLTRGMPTNECRKIATQAAMVAAVPLFGFIFFGSGLLALLSVSMSSFQVAGGIVLIFLGLQLALGIAFPKDKEDENDKSAIAVVIGTPLITGPAVIATSILLADKFGKETTALAGLAALVGMWLVLWFAAFIHDKLGRSGLKVLSTMMGIITIAWGVEFIRTGLA